MVTYRPVPAKILTIDYVGVATSVSETHRKRAEQELTKLEGQVLRGDLSQGVRRVDLGDNVKVECTVCFNLKEAKVIIGAGLNSRLTEQSCYCCSPCLVAGMIIETNSIDTTDPNNEIPLYEKEEDYYATIEVCQAPDTTSPRSITLHEERKAGGKSIKETRVLQSKTYGVELLYDVIYSDYQNHKPGETVLVLVQPMYDFNWPPYGRYTPCVNNRQVANEVFEYPQIITTVDFINSSGMSCQIVQDKQIWTYDEVLSPLGDIKRFPFRVLPIKIESCL
jgi:hypothetical protein